MTCLFDHNWSWPRRRGEKDVQFCPNCGAERESKVRFDAPHYHRTQEALVNFVALPIDIEADARFDDTDDFSSMAA